MPDQPPPPPTTVGPMGTSFADVLKATFPDGVIPSAQPQSIPGVQPAPAPIAPQPAPIAPQPAPIAPQPTAPAAPIAPVAPVDGPSGPAATGPTTTGPAPTATGPAATGPALTQKEQLDAAEKAMTMQAGTAFKIVRAENAALEKQLEAERAKREEAEAKAAESTTSSKEVTELREKVKNYEKTLSVTNLEATEAFQQEIARPIKAVEGVIKQLATKYEVPANELQVALAEPDPSKRSDMLSELSAKFNRLDTAAFDRAILDLNGLQVARETALSNAAQELERSRANQTQSQASASKKFVKDWEAARDSALADLTTDKTAVGVMFTPTGDEKFDADVNSALAQVKSLDITKLTNQQIAAELYKGRVLPLATQLIAKQYSEIEVLKAEVESLRGGTPPIGTGISSGVVPPPAAQPQTFAQAAKTALQGVLPP